uniref:Uncharacterized protein n=1 Tax=Tanacetum cinerariifolium TaxID=118510 RepID=A0A6L2N291_TANCI|nr:hypothetical protein [Tanacetum cinerariifolium]
MYVGPVAYHNRERRNRGNWKVKECSDAWLDDIVDKMLGKVIDIVVVLVCVVQWWRARVDPHCASGDSRVKGKGGLGSGGVAKSGVVCFGGFEGGFGSCESVMANLFWISARRPERKQFSKAFGKRLVTQLLILSKSVWYAETVEYNGFEPSKFGRSIFGGRGWLGGGGGSGGGGRGRDGGGGRAWRRVAMLLGAWSIAMKAPIGMQLI